MKIRWIGQSGYIIKTDTTEIMIDPYLSDVVNRVANRARLVEAPIQPKDIHADAVICTHNHLDHLDVDAVAAMDPSLLFLSTNEGVEKLQELGRTNTRVCVPGDSIRIGDVEITAVHACHSAEAFGVIVKHGGITLYFSGDTLYDEKLFSIAEYQPDITFICINGRLGNMNVEEALITAQKIGARVNVPNHYGMFASNTEDPAKFTGKLSNGFEMEFNREYLVGKNGLQRL
ncbi:MAG: MBL fold metallo-hydrolase [Lachnospiraceae bacterium]|nr:MBL fold metallo-hydrolase [Lachnospiraceae bacterium]